MLRVSIIAISSTLLAVGATGCESSTALEQTPDASLLPASREVVLEYGDDIRLEGSVLRLSFGEVLEDSRCPVDVTCVWEGNGKVVIGIAAGMGPTHALILNTSLEPRSVVWSGIRVTLLELTPAPHAGTPIPPQDYAVRLRLEPLA
jgi:hypothetical protein